VSHLSTCTNSESRVEIDCRWVAGVGVTSMSSRANTHIFVVERFER
jgi:hypothetical protein